MENVNFLTDPIWSESCSPISFLGPKRLRPPPLPLEELPPISFVVVSHSHYDHLDVQTVQSINDRFPDAIWYVPDGLKQWFHSRSVDKVVELNWWQRANFNEDITVVCTPAQHWSQRTPFDRMKSLWGSFVVKGKEHSVYFAGDTGYCPVFKTIGEEYGPFDVSLLPIGAYCPNEFMKPQHVNPQEAVMMHQDLQSKVSIGMHWGTFVLTDEPLLEPPQKLETALKSAGVDRSKFFVMKHGETVRIGKESL